LNLDMIAYPLTSHRTFHYDARQYRDAITGLIAEAARAVPEMEPRPGPRVYRSDHNAGATVGYPSIGFAEHVRTSLGKTRMISPNYHTPRDVMAPLDLEYALGIVKFVGALAAIAADSTEDWSLNSDSALREAACARSLGI
jgi:Zn-dependent M28 family amino/carboxypeptidase